MARGIVERVRLGLSTYGVHLGVGCTLALAITSLHAAHVWPWLPPAELPASHDEPRPRCEPEATIPEVASVTRVPGQHMDVDVVVGACRVGVACVVRLQLIAHGSFHMSQEYPQKFVADANSQFELLGQGSESRTFRQSLEAFRLPGEEVMTLMVTLVPNTAGSAPLSGIVKATVCDDEVCVIETPHITVAVPIS